MRASVARQTGSRQTSPLSQRGRHRPDGLFKAYVLREQLDRLWTYKTREGVARFLFGWLKALRWPRLPEMEKLGDRW
jgi:hypothetical protein